MVKKAASQKSVSHSQRHYLGRRGQAPLIQESWTRDAQGPVIGYSLAYIDFSLCAVDNGRVLGYDNGHGYHERHWMGRVQATEFTNYRDQAERFFDVVAALRRGDV